MRLRLAVFCALVASLAQASSPHKEVVTFSFTSNVGVGNSVYVVGSHPDVGNWDVTQAIKLRYTAGNIWTGQVAIQAGTQLQYRFISRSNSNANWCNAANVTYLTSNLSTAIAAQPDAPCHGKTIYYLSGWNPPNLFYNNNGTWTSAAMARASAGRMSGESLYKISGIGAAGENLEFVFTDGSGHYDNPPGGGNYLNDLDVFEVQDGNVFSYQPPATVSAPTIITHFVDSTANNIPGRNVHVYLPRGYTQNTTRRYPVLYFHDGQNVFGQSGSWSADGTATREIGQGRVRETIMVGIDNDDDRIPEYMPPTDSYQGTQGRGDAYADFVINNVRPYLDFNFRTLNDPKNTLTVGSSLGGLISLYFGREFSVFGKIGLMSPEPWIAPNYAAQVRNGSKKSIRVYMDFGTAEPLSNWNDALSLYDMHLGQSYSENDDLLFLAGCGQDHNEAAWAARLPTALHYLLPAREEPNELLQREFAPAFVLSGVNIATNTATFSYASFFGFTYTLSRSSNLADWSPLVPSTVETLPWANHSLGDSFPAGVHFWRLTPTSVP